MGLSIGNPYRLSGSIVGMPTKTLGDRVIEIRDALKMNQGEFARAIKIRQPSLSDIETGETKNPAARTLLAMVALGANPEYIMDGKGPKLLRDIERKLMGDTIVSMWDELDNGEQEVVMNLVKGLIRRKGKRTSNDPYNEDPPIAEL